MMTSRYDHDDNDDSAEREALQSERYAQHRRVFIDSFYPIAAAIADDSDSYDEARGVAALTLEELEFAIVDGFLRGIFGKGDA